MRIIFMGTPEFAVPSLEILIKNGYEIAAVVTQPDRPKGRGRRLAPPPVREYAEKAGLKVVQPEKVKTPEFLSWLREIEPELLVTVAYGRILSKEVLEVPKYGCINVHASLLPRYRGAAPIQWSLINGEKVTGVTTMYTDIGVDTGDMLLKREVAVAENMTAGELHELLAPMGAEVLLETLKRLENGTLTRTPQPQEESSYAPVIHKETGKIDWNRTSLEIHNLVRGTNPWPTAFTLYQGERLKVWKTRLIPDSDAVCRNRTNGGERPGTICRITRGGLIVKTGDGYIDIEEVQFDCCRRMGVNECGHNINEGEILG